MTAGFGLERLGLLALKCPRVTLLTVAAITAALIFFAVQITYASDIREIFRSNSLDYTQYEEVTALFPDTDNDILLVVEGGDIFTPDNLERLRTLHLDLALEDGVRYVLSMFSARRPPGDGSRAEAVFPPDLSTIDDLQKLRQEVQGHPLVSGKLLSEDARRALIVIALEGHPNVAELQKMTGYLKQTVTEILDGSRLQAHMTGLAYMRLEIIGALIRDQATFSIIGLIVGFLLCWLFLRSATYAAIAAAPSFAAPASLLGLMRLGGHEVTVMTSVVPALVMVIVFADALHLLFSMRRNLAAGRPIEEAVRIAVLRVGPACVLTSLTTTLALLSLTLVPHPFVANLGFVAAIGTVVAYAATLTIVPALARLLLGRGSTQDAPGKGQDMTQTVTAGVCGHVVRAVQLYPRSLLVSGVLLAMAATALYTLAQPRYQYREYLPGGNPALLALQRIDASLAGTESLLLFAQLPSDQQLESQEALDVARDAHKVLAETGLVRAVSSVHSVELWLSENGQRNSQDVFRFISQAKSPLSTRIASLDSNSMLFTGHFPGTDSTVLLPVLASLEGELAELRKKYPGVRLILTGLSAVSAKASRDMIDELNRSLLTAMCAIILLIGVSLRSLKASLFAVLPNVLPVAVAGSLLFMTGYGLQFNSVVAFTVGFGIAVDNTIHMLNRFNLMRRDGMAVDESLAATTMTVGPVLIIGTAVLVFGLGSTLLSTIPSMKLFGLMSVVLLISALVANLIFLPSLIAVVERRSERT